MTAAMEMTDWRKMNRAQQVLLYVVCELQQLKELGVVSGGHVVPAPKAMQAFAEMQTEGFEISRAEITDAIKTMEAHYKRSVIHAVPA